jgi:septum formation protein
VVVSGVAEDDIAGDTSAVVAELARRKAQAVASRRPDALVIGCDSLLDVDGVAWGKATSAEQAVERWRTVRGRSATLLTGHCLIDARAGAGGATASEVVATTVRFGRPSDAEVDAYVATGEPLTVAGGFTIEGRGAPFVEAVNGDPGNVIGLSLPALRRLLAQLGVAITDLWG